MTTTKVIRLSEVLSLTSLNKSTLYELMSTNQFPRPLQISKRRVGWLHTDIIEWIESRSHTSSVKSIKPQDEESIGSVDDV